MDAVYTCTCAGSQCTANVSAAMSLRQGDLLLSEEVHVGGLIADPPFLANDLLHKAIAELSQKLGGDQYRGPRIGGYMHNIGMTDIRCNSFVPLYGRGVTLNPWCSMQELCTKTNALSWV